MKKKLQLKTSHRGGDVSRRPEEKKELPQFYSQEELRIFKENLKQAAKRKKK